VARFGDGPNAFRQESLVKVVLIDVFLLAEKPLKGFGDLPASVAVAGQFDTPQTCPPIVEMVMNQINESIKLVGSRYQNTDLRA
jgi:hypothetical protein